MRWGQVSKCEMSVSNGFLFVGIYYFITIGIVSLATGMTVCTLNIHHKGTRGKLVPPWVEFICFKILAKIFCIPIEYPDANLLKEQPYVYQVNVYI